MTGDPTEAGPLARRGRGPRRRAHRARDARVEKMLDHLERLLLSGKMSPKDYADNVIDLSRWAEAQRRTP